MNLKFLQIDINNKDTMEIFYKFYREIIVPNFDDNECETIIQFENELKLEDDNRKYYIIVILDDDTNTLGGIIFDYLADTNVGLIEYIVTDSKQKRKGIASASLKFMVNILNNEAKKRGCERIKFICGEVEKQINGREDKHYFWEKYGFKKLDFNYIQPALDSEKQPVEIMDFGIMTKIPNAEFLEKGINSKDLINILYDYYGEEPNSEITLSKMKKEIEDKGDVILLVD